MVLAIKPVIQMLKYVNIYREVEGINYLKYLPIINYVLLYHTVSKLGQTGVSVFGGLL